MKKEKTELKFEIKKNYGVLSEAPNGWKKEINLVSWNDKEEKIDIRSWSADHTRMRKGISLTKEEVISLCNILNEMKL